jgi:DNA mismatch repair protein MutS2
MPPEALKPGPSAESFAARPLDFEALRLVLERHAATSLGLRAVRALAPRRNEDARAALERTREMLELERGQRTPNLGGLCDPLPALVHARTAGRPLEDENLVKLVGMLEACERLAEWLCTLDGAPALAQLGGRVPEFDGLLERLRATVDEQGRVREHASPMLFRLRKQEAEVASELERTLRAILSRSDVRAVLSDPNPMRRGGRPVLAIKSKSAGRIHGIVHDRSQTGETVFVEPREVVALGNRHSELVSDERREVERILSELTREVLRHEPQIELAAATLAELELAFVGARWALETHGRVPLLPREKGASEGMLLRNARHPLLLEQQRIGRLSEVVPIDLRLGGDFDVLIITGPNTGGKTLALKSAGLFALCTRMGLPFPCEQGSTCPLYDGIVADIGDEQEISQSLSTFSSHLKRIREGLARATNATLVLLDELGSGTDPDEGAALSEALLEVLLARKSPTLVSTHIGKLKEFAFRHPRAENACVEFDAVTLAPCYHLIVGMPGESGALVIAKRLGLPGEIVERAKERLVRRDEELTLLMADMRNARTQAEKARGAAESRLEDAERMRVEAVEQKRALEQKSELLEAEAQQSIEERVRNATRVLERARALLEQLPAAQAGAMQQALAELEAELSGSALSARRAEFLATLKKGSFVYVPRYKQRLVVQKVDRAARELTVQLGSMRMSVSFDEVSAWEGR